MSLVSEYIRLAEKWGTALEGGESETANLLFDRVQNLYGQLVEKGQESLLFGQIQTAPIAARFFIASHLKQSDSATARKVYSQLSNSSRPFISLSAGHALNEMESLE
jgi:hypothetical protein